MQYKMAGGFNIPLISLGTAAYADDRYFGPQDMRSSIDAVHAAIDLGVTLIDTAEAYGNGVSETVIGKALEGWRDKVLIATKAWSDNLREKDIIRACEKSLKRLKTDVIDIYQIHWFNPEIPVSETLAGAGRLKEQGKIRAFSVCNAGASKLREFPDGSILTNQLPYSLIWRAIEYEIKPACLQSGIGIFCYSPLAQGLLSGKYLDAGSVPEGRDCTRFYSGKRRYTRHGEKGFEDEVFAVINRIRDKSAEWDLSMTSLALGWLKMQDGVLSVITGARSPQQINEIVDAASCSLTSEMMQELSRLTEPLKLLIGKNADMWESEANSRIK